MYIIINNKSKKATTTKQKVIVASLLNCHRNTITNNLKKSNPFEYKQFTVYEGNFIKDNVSSGNKDNLQERQRKWREKNELQCNLCNVSLGNKCTTNPAKRMKEQIKNIEKDLNIVIEAINNGDTKDAVSMLKDIQEDLKVIALVSEQQ